MQLGIGTPERLVQPSGDPIKSVREAVYLGGLVTCDGKSLPELKRRLGEGRKALDVLSELWAHTGISRRRKIEIYKACVVSKVIYSLESLWLLSSEVKRLDAFHVACLRKISGIKHSYVSRVSNAEVLQQTGERPLSELLLHRQCQLYDNITKKPLDDPLRKLVCKEDGSPQVWVHTRRRGRPRQTWARQVYAVVSQAS